MASNTTSTTSTAAAMAAYARGPVLPIPLEHSPPRATVTTDSGATTAVFSRILGPGRSAAAAGCEVRGTTIMPTLPRLLAPRDAGMHFEPDSHSRAVTVGAASHLPPHWDPMSRREVIAVSARSRSSGGAAAPVPAGAASASALAAHSSPHPATAAPSGATPLLSGLALRSVETRTGVLGDPRGISLAAGVAAAATASFAGDRFTFRDAREAENALARLLPVVAGVRVFPVSFSSPGPGLSADLFSRAVIGCKFQERRPPASGPAYSSAIGLSAPGGAAATSAAVKAIPPFREQREDEGNENCARALSAYKATSNSKPHYAAPSFGEGSLILNTWDNLPIYYRGAKEELRTLVKDILIYMALHGRVDDFSSAASVDAVKAIFPDLEATATHIMPVVEGIISKGMCFGFAMSFAAYLLQEKDLKKSQAGFTDAFMALEFNKLAPLIQFLRAVQAKTIQAALSSDDKKRYEDALQAAGGIASVTRKLVLSAAPPEKNLRYSTGRVNMLTLMEHCIRMKHGLGVHIEYKGQVLPELKDTFSPEAKITFLEAQILTLMRKYRNHPVAFCFESHALCFYTTDKGLYLLDDGNKGCKLFASEEEAKRGIAEHVRSYGKDLVLECHIFSKVDA